MADGAVGPGLTEQEPIRINIKFLAGGSQLQTGFTLRKQGALLADAQAAVQDVVDNFLTPFRGILATQDRILAVEGTNIVSKAGGIVEPENMMGTTNFATLHATGQCAVVSLKSGFKQRYSQGRMFWPVRGEESTTENELNANGLGFFNTALNALRAQYIEGGISAQWRLVNEHPLLPSTRPTKRPTPLPEVPAHWYDVQSVRINRTLTWLRSRRAGNGS